MTRRLHQFVPTLDPGAVATHVLEIQRALRRSGWESEVFSEHTRSPYEGAAHHYTEYGRSVAAHDDDVLVYHLAIGSTVADWLLQRRPRRLVVFSHNITPPWWFETWEPGISYGLAWGTAQLAQLARRSVLGIGVSAFNASELARHGFRKTRVVPILVDLDRLSASVDASCLERLREGQHGVTWLFVGRLAPNKCQQDIVKAFTVFRRAYDPSARLWLVGGASAASYERAVMQFAVDAGVGDAVLFTGAVTPGELAARYRAADVFVCLSEHEGFLVPLLECWHAGLPTVAYAAAAVPETLGRAGLLLYDKAPPVVAAAVARLLSDPNLAQAFVQAGLDRLDCFSLQRTGGEMVELASELAAGRFDRPAEIFFR